MKKAIIVLMVLTASVFVSLVNAQTKSRFQDMLHLLALDSEQEFNLEPEGSHAWQINDTVIVAEVNKYGYKFMCYPGKFVACSEHYLLTEDGGKSRLFYRHALVDQEREIHPIKVKDIPEYTDLCEKYSAKIEFKKLASQSQNWSSFGDAVHLDLDHPAWIEELHKYGEIGPIYSEFWVDFSDPDRFVLFWKDNDNNGPFLGMWVYCSIRDEGVIRHKFNIPSDVGIQF